MRTRVKLGLLVGVAALPFLLSRGEGLSEIRHVLSLTANSEGGVTESVCDPAISSLGAADFTWEAWIKPGSISQSGSRVFGQFDDANGTGLALEIRQDGGSATLSLVSGATRLDGTTALGDAWAHVAVVRAGNVVSLYLNGTKEVEGAEADLPAVPFAFGGGMNGSLAEVRVWKHARSVERLIADRAIRLAPTSVGLVACWRLDETSGVPRDVVSGRKATVTGYGKNASFVEDATLPVSSDTVTSGPIACYKMENVVTSGSTRTVANSMRGTGALGALTLGEGCTLVEAAGPCGNAMYFNGTKAAWATTAVPALSNRSISFWVKLDKEDGPIYTNEYTKATYPYYFGAFSRMRGYYSSMTDGYCASGLGYNGETQFYGANMCKIGLWTRDSWQYMTYTVSMTDTDNPAVKTATIKLYLNGTLQYEMGTLDVTNAVAAQTFCLGNSSTNGNRPLTGLMDEVTLWDRTLSDEEVFALYASRHYTPPSEELARWDMNEIEQVSVTSPFVATGKIADKSASGNDLMVNSGCTLTDGVVGKALHFDGTSPAQTWAKDYVKAVHGFTLCGWIKMSSQPLPGVGADGKTTNTAPRFYVWSPSYVNFMSTTNDLRLALQQHQAENKVETVTTAMTARDVWSHLAVTENVRLKEDRSGFETLAEVYVNGERTYQGPAKATVNPNRLCFSNEVRFVLGCINAWANQNRPFFGDMDEVSLHSGALGPQAIRAMMQIPAVPQAGADFTVVTTTATLHGTRTGVTGVVDGATGGSVEWTQVSGPADATIDAPEALDTAVRLPANGTYVFKLTTRTAAGVCSDTVAVTRQAPTGSEPLPTLTISAQPACEMPAKLLLTANGTPTDGSLRIHWRVKGGPGAAIFDDANAATTELKFLTAGTYEIECTAESAAGCASAKKTVVVSGTSARTDVTDGLLNYWPVGKGGSQFLADIVGGRNLTLSNAAVSDVRAVSGGRSLLSTGNTPQASTANLAFPSADFITVSFWMYHEPGIKGVDDVTDSGGGNRSARVVNYNTAFELQYDLQKEVPDFTLRGWDASANYATWCFGAPQTNTRNRWAHVAVVVDLRAATDARQIHRFYVDGVAMNSTKMDWYDSGNNRKAGVVKFDGMRKSTKNVRWFSCGAVRNFSGYLDEMRIYGRALSADEVKALANADFSSNQAPTVTVGTDVPTVSVKKTVKLPVAAQDDGLAFGTVDGRWKLVEGVADNILFADWTRGVFQFRKGGTYAFVFEATDGSYTTASEPVRVTVLGNGFTILIK